MFVKTYYWYKNQGICPKCRKNKIEDGKSCCRECLDKINERQKKKIRDGLMKKRYWERKNKGVCVVCGRTLCRCSSTRCGYHQAQEDAYNGRTRDPEGYIGLDGSLPSLPKKTKLICNEDCFNCKFEDCIKPC